MPEFNHKAVLSIAGSDPSGGAGIQADLKTFTALGVYGGAVITCLTAQNTSGVHSYTLVDPDFVDRQIRLVLDDLPVTHIKIGMVGSAAIAEAINRALQGFTGEVIYDPVMLSSSGSALLDQDALAAVRRLLVGRATVITPNLLELEMLSAHPCTNREELLTAGQQLIKEMTGLRSLIVTGGHLEEDKAVVRDFLISEKGTLVHEHRHPRYATANTHGTGCTFSSAFAALHLQHGNDRQAFDQAIEFMGRLLAAGINFSMGSGGSGPLPHHLVRFP